ALGDYPICMSCGETVVRNMPGVKFDDLVIDKDADESKAEELSKGIGMSEDDVKNAKRIAMHDSASSDQSIYMKYSGLRFPDVLREFGVAPKALNLPCAYFKTLKGREFYYILQRVEQFKVKYPTIKLESRSSISIFTRPPDDTARLIYSNQDQMMLAAANSQTIEGTRDASAPKVQPLQLSIKSVEDLKEEAEKLKEKKTMRDSRRFKRRSNDELLEAGDVSSSDPAVDSDHDHNHPIAFPPPGPKGSSGPLPSPSPPASRAGSRASVTTEAPNPHQCGTVNYWLFELKFEKAFDGSNLGQPLNQATLIQPKLGEADRAILTKRMDLARQAVAMNVHNCHNMKDQDLVENANNLRQAGALPTPKLWVALAKRYTDNTVKKVDEMTDAVQIKAALVDYLNHMCMWNGSGKLGLGDSSVAKPPLRLTRLKDQQMAQVFRDNVIKVMLLKWVCAGEKKAGHVAAFISAAADVWDQVPEDANLGDKCALEFTNACTAIAVLQLLSHGTTFDLLCAPFDVQESLQQIHVKATELALDHDSVVMLAAALTTRGYWNEKISHMNTILTKTSSEDGVKMRAAYVDVRKMITDGSTETANALAAHCGSVTYWESCLGKGYVDDLRGEIIRIGLGSARTLLEKINSRSGPSDVGATLNAHKQLFKIMDELDPSSEDVLRANKDLTRALSDLDLSSKHAILVQSVTNWRIDNEASTAALKDAVMACDGKKLPDETAPLADKMISEILEHILGGMSDKDVSEFRIVDVHVLTAFDLLARMTNHAEKTLKMVTLMQYARATQYQIVKLRDHDTTPGDSPEKTASPEELTSHMDAAVRMKTRCEAAYAAAADVLNDYKIAKDSVPMITALAADVIAEFGLKARTAIQEAVDKGIQKVNAKIDSTEGLITWKEKKTACNSIDEYVDLYTKALEGIDLDFIVGPTDTISDHIREHGQLTAKYSLDPQPDWTKAVNDDLDAARAPDATMNIMKFLSTPSIMKDKVAMQRKAAAVSEKLKKWKLVPTLLDDIILQRFKLALKYK
ncbi:unnamed protein product, partial [Prorocentrum cordatum]